MRLISFSGSFPSRTSRSGFSLMEVILTLAILALALPAMLAIFASFSQTSADTVNREEAARAFGAISLYLNAGTRDAATGTPLGTAAQTSAGDYFSTVLGWVRASTPTFIYAYRTVSNSGSSGYLVSLTAPAPGTWSGTLMVGEIKPLLTNEQAKVGFLTDATLTATPYTKTYIPLELAIYAGHSAIPSGQTSLPASSLIDTYPVVVMR